MPTATLPQGHLHYESRGDGPPLLAVLPQSSGPFGTGPALDALARRHRVITFSPRGTAGSSAAPSDLSMATQTADTAALLDALDLPRAVLLCHSTGCGVGFTLAAKQPDRVGKLVLVSPWTHGDPFLTAMQALRTAAARSLDPEQYARFNAAVLFPPAFRRQHETGFARLAKEAASRPQDAEGFARRLAAIVAFDARPLLGAIRCPTLVITARDDQLMPPWFAEAAAAGITGARLVQLDGGGHMLLETRPGEIGEEVDGFLGDA